MQTVDSKMKPVTRRGSGESDAEKEGRANTNQVTAG